MPNCPDCNNNIISSSTSIIGSTKCNPDCPPETTCEDIIPSSCVYYSGQNLPCTGINYGDSLSVSLSKIDSKYGVRVSATDNCCGYLNTKIVSDTISITQDVVDDCQVLRLETSGSGGDCSPLIWEDLILTDFFISNENDIILQNEGDEDPINLGKRQKVQYAIEYCGESIKKIWFRGLIEVIPSVPIQAFEIVANLPLEITPTRVRVVPLLLLDGYCGDTATIPNLVFTPGSSPSSPGFLRYINGSSANCSYYISLDGFSYEIN